jgi:uracil-DNA glycosylase
MSLDLDERQRAMLKAMGVRVWWPKMAAEPTETEKPFVSKLTDKNDVILNKITSKTVAINSINARLNSQEIKVIDSNIINFDSNRDTANLTWPALQQAVAACRACALCEGRTQTVFGVGQAPAGGDAAPQVDWLIVGEAPGENEDRVGEPFVGQAGQLLDNMLKAMTLARRDKVYIANVIKCRPPGNRNPTHDEVAQCEPYLHRQIALLRPKMILALGKYAATSLLRATVPEVDKTPLGKLRGRVHAYTHAGLTVPVVATYHPAYLLRSLTEKAKAWEDLCLAMDALAQQSPNAGSP